VLSALQPPIRPRVLTFSVSQTGISACLLARLSDFAFSDCPANRLESASLIGSALASTPDAHICLPQHAAVLSKRGLSAWRRVSAVGALGGFRSGGAPLLPQTLVANRKYTMSANSLLRYGI